MSSNGISSTSLIGYVRYVLVLVLVIVITMVSRANETPETKPHKTRPGKDLSHVVSDYKPSSLSHISSDSLLAIYRLIWDRYQSGNLLETVHIGRTLLEFSTENASKDKIDILAKSLITMGNVYYGLKEFGIALDYYFRAATAYEQIKNQVGSALAYENIALVYQSIKDYQAAFDQYQKSLKYYKAENITKTGWTFASIAGLYIAQNQSEIAEMYLDSALAQSIKDKNKALEAYTHRRYGWLYSTKKEFTKSQNYYLIAIALEEQNGDNKYVLKAADSLANSYYLTGQYRKCIETCSRYLELAEQIKNFELIQSLSQPLFNAYVALEDYRSAVGVKKKYRYAKDSMDARHIESVILMTELRSKVDNEINLLKQQDEIKNQTIRVQNTVLGATIIGLVILIIISVLIYRAFVTNKKLSIINKSQSDRLKQLDEAKSRFFANISHDLRTPLSLMMGGIEQVLESNDVYLTEKAERQLKTGLNNGKRIIHLTNEINELIKLEDSNLKIHRQFVNMDELLHLFVAMFHSMAQMKGIKFAYSKAIFDEIPIVSIDVNQFEKVLFNLITNALKHSKPGDMVTITLNKAGLNQLELSVIDSGVGIPEANVPYIFERYYQAPNASFKTQQGFGIGLALVKEIIDKHEAAITVKSKDGEGTQFTITLPLEKVATDQVHSLKTLAYSDETRLIFRDLEERLELEKPVVKVPAVNGKKPAPIKSETVLIVEDHPEVRQYIEDIINEYYHVLTANNGKRALKVLGDKKVDLVITDLMMPWLDGFELLEHMKATEAFSKIPVLVLSARTSEEDKERVLSKGINDFLHKPFNAKELLTRISNLLSQRSKWNNNNEGALFINNEQTISDVETALLQKVENMVLDKIDDPNLAVRDLAIEIAVSERKFFRLIKKLTNSTPYEYVKEIRLQYAKKLIDGKRIASTSEAAKKIGMNNVSNFSKQYHSRFGKRPSDLLENA